MSELRSMSCEMSVSVWVSLRPVSSCEISNMATRVPAQSFSSSAKLKSLSATLSSHRFNQSAIYGHVLALATGAECDGAKWLTEIEHVALAGSAGERHNVVYLGNGQVHTLIAQELHLLERVVGAFDL